jgi:hypothetical protein
MPEIQVGDMAKIATPTDFVGVNFYTPAHVESVPMRLFVRYVTPPDAS